LPSAFFFFWGSGALARAAGREKDKSRQQKNRALRQQEIAGAKLP
jgi:hypothetical protein